MTNPQQSSPIGIFISYSHRDAELCEALREHLSPLRREGQITTWHDEMILPGDHWDKAIAEHLATADIILLLISASFLASDYCFSVEMDRALERHAAGTACVIPVILRHVDWKTSRLSELKALPRDARPVTAWENQDKAFTDVTKGIRKAVESLQIRRAQPTQEVVATSGHEPQPDTVRKQLKVLAKNYERARQKMTPGRDRTAVMDGLLAAMKQLAPVALDLLPEFSRSVSPGERLAAVSMLQVVGDAKYLHFLANCIIDDKPFVGYHAALALEYAVGALDTQFRLEVAESVDAALASLDSKQGDRAQILLRAREACTFY